MKFDNYLVIINKYKQEFLLERKNNYVLCMQDIIFQVKGKQECKGIKYLIQVLIFEKYFRLIIN